MNGYDVYVLATQNEQVVWNLHTNLTTGNLTSINAAVASDPRAYSSGGVVATWGMTFGPTTASGPDRIQVIDQCSRRWAIDPSGVATYLGMPPGGRVKPFRDLGVLLH